MNLNERQLMDFELVTSSEEIEQELNLIIYYTINGKMIVHLGEKASELSEKDFIIINPFHNHSVEMNQTSLAIRFMVNLGILSQYYDMNDMEFQGNSVGETAGPYVKLSGLLEKCIAFYYGKGLKDGRILLKLNSLYYEIAELLVSSFLVVRVRKLEKNSEDYDKILIQNIARYVRMNFQSALTLEDLADHFYLSTAYISRYFKKNMGINFSKYLTELRLEEAVRELESTQKSLTRIIMDCGFPNQASFLKVFKEKYHMSPKIYRSSLRQKKESQSMEVAQPNQAEFKLMDYLEKSEGLLADDYDEIEQLEANTGAYTILNKSWNKLINIGGVSLFLQKEIQDHTVYLCKTLGYEYVRVWDLYEESMHIHVGDKNRKYNFSRLDICFDFFTENHIKPYIELGFKPYVLVNDYSDFTFNEEREIPFERPEEFGIFVKNIIMHFINRYSLKEVSTWFFELWCDYRWFPDGNASIYIEYFEQAYQAIKELSPLTKVGGDYDRTYDGIVDFEALIRRWSTRNIQPDFISIYCYPSIARDTLKKEFDMIQTMREYDFRSFISEKKTIVMRYGMLMPLYSSEMNFTVINSNVLNDSRFKGAFLMKVLMDAYDAVDMIGYWFGTDLFVENYDAPMLLNGRCGLITHQKIRKPAYWAIHMMNRLENYLLAKSENAMVTMNEFDSYVITCHNYKELDIQYYVQKEREVTIESIPHLYVNNKRLILKIKVTGVRNGVYHIKTRTLNSQYGGVQDEWVRMGKVIYLTKADVEYIEHTSCPRITISKQVVSDHTLSFTAELEPQEMQLIHAFRYMEENH